MKKFFALMAVLMAVASASATPTPTSTPYKDLFVQVDANPTGAGTVYLAPKDDTDAEYLVESSEEPGETAFIKLVFAENGNGGDYKIGCNKNQGVYEVMAKVAPAEGYELVCLADKIADDGVYGPDDCYPSIVGATEGSRTISFNWTGEDIININAASHDEDGNSSSNRTREYYKNPSLFNDTPDTRVYAIFRQIGEEFPKFTDNGEHIYENGICLNAGCEAPYQEPDLAEDGFYELKNAGHVEWFSNHINTVDINASAKMMNDIDFTGVKHSPIGCSDAKKFNGIFDGQGFRIKNLIMDEPDKEYVAFFGWARGGVNSKGENTTIKNLIMDKSCSFRAKGRVAAFVATSQVSGWIYIQNCINEAPVNATEGAGAGFYGTRQQINGDQAHMRISNCVNLGDITAENNEKNVAAFIAFWEPQNNSGNGNSIIENSYNAGVVTPCDGETTLFRGTFRTITNTYDLANMSNQGTPLRKMDQWGTEDPVASGELAYYINQQAGEIIFYQTLGDNGDAYPIPFATSKQVYEHANYRCDGVALPGAYYDNEDSTEANIPPHDYSDNGFCQNEGCTKPNQPAETDEEGWALLANAGNVEWLSETVAANGGNYVAKAKLTADIDFEGKENLHSPIGPNTGCKFKGEFDGQGHRIMNMVINRPNDSGIGFFGWLQGNANTTIRNLIIDETCSIVAGNKAGGVAGASQNYNEEATITIENVVNSASVTVSGQDAAGIVGGEDGNKANYYVHNVVNTGTITSTHEYPYAGALFCYQERGTVQNFLNLGTINGHLGGNIGRFFGGTWKNVVDLSDTEDADQFIVDDLTKEDIASGYLAYYMNDNAEDADDAFFQTIGTDAYPVPFQTSAKVYGEKWDGINVVVYNNLDGEVMAGNVVISDEAEAFALPEEATSVTAMKVAYERSNVQNFNSVVLPFAFTTADLPEGAVVYKAETVEENYVIASEVTEVAAGEPVLVWFPADYEGTWNVNLTDATLATTLVDGLMKGSFEKKAIGAGLYKLNEQGTAFGKTTDDAIVKAFRTYIATDTQAKELFIGTGGETGIAGTISDLSDLKAVYNLNGQQTNRLQKGVNIVRMANGETKTVIVK